MNFIKEHKVLAGIIGGVVIFLLACFIAAVVRGKRDEDKIKRDDAPNAVLAEETQAPTEAPTPQPTSQYQASLGIENLEDGDGRVTLKPTPTPVPTPTVKKRTSPKYPVMVDIFDHTGVPKVNVDGSSYKTYMKGVSLADFGTYWGSSLTANDFNGHKQYLVGVEQKGMDTPIKGDLNSVGWLMDNLKKLKKNDAITFVNLHVIGHLSDTHTALLCTYDWYSAYGLQDTMVVFEDISNTLDDSHFKPGDIFSATIYVHNMKVKTVNGQRVVVCQYQVFPAK